MQYLLVILALSVGITFPHGSIFATPEEELFSNGGRVTRIAATEKVLYVKTEGGLELTFRVDDETQIMIGEEAKSFADVGAGDRVEIDYVYNEDYEKVARLIKKRVSPAPASL